MSSPQAFCITLLICWAGGTFSALVTSVLMNGQAFCIPWMTGCYGFLELGIPDPGSYFYRGFLITGSTILAAWYLAMGRWLSAHGEQRRASWIIGLGVVASVTSVAVISLLRPEREEVLWRLIQQLEVVLIIAQLAANGLILASANRQGIGQGSTSWNIKSWAYRGQLILALVLVTNYFLEFGGAVLRAMEWWYVAMTVAFYISSFPEWRRFHLTLRPDD